MKQNNFLSFVVCATLASSTLLHGEKEVTQADLDEVSPAKQPNIVFLLTDDQRWDTLGCYGRTDVVTPHIDKLAANGVTFDNAYHAVAICMPSRATMLTGRYFSDHQVGFAYPYDRAFTAEEFADSYPAQLKKAGYRTGFVGKFGVRLERLDSMLADQFDYYTIIPGAGKRGRDIVHQSYATDERLNEIHSKTRDPKERTLIKGDSMIHFLDTQPSGQPFCLSVSFDAVKNDKDDDMYGPHVELFEGKEMWVPGNYVAGKNERLPKVLDHGRGTRLHLQRTATPEEYQRRTRRFAVQGYTVDQQVKRLMDKLEEMGELDNTIVIYTSDNGRFHGAHGIFDKCILYDEAVKQPLIIFDPRAKESSRGTRIDAMVSSTDVAPTILSLMGLEAPASMKGLDLSGLLDGSQDMSTWREAVLMENLFIEEMFKLKKGDKDKLNTQLIADNQSYRSRGVRTERYKYFSYHEHDPVVEELYDLEEDPLEVNNLAGNKEYSVLLGKLREKAKSLLEDSMN